MNRQHPDISTRNCAIYARTSRPPDDSLELQIQICRKAAESEGWNVAEHHVFQDKRGRAGCAPLDERPGMRSLIEAATSDAHPIDVVLVESTERLSRKTRDTLGLISILSRAGVSVRVA